MWQPSLKATPSAFSCSDCFHWPLQRLLLASLNGLAGLLALQELPADAVRLYREALATGECRLFGMAPEQR